MSVRRLVRTCTVVWRMVRVYDTIPYQNDASILVLYQNDVIITITRNTRLAYEYYYFCCWRECFRLRVGDNLFPLRTRCKPVRVWRCGYELAVTA
jgi:hypothetical protein